MLDGSVDPELMVAELTKQIFHLTRSNSELQREIDAGDNDEEYHIAIRENTVIIEQKKLLLVKFQEEISVARGGKQTSCAEKTTFALGPLDDDVE